MCGILLPLNGQTDGPCEVIGQFNNSFSSHHVMKRFSCDKTYVRTSERQTIDWIPNFVIHQQLLCTQFHSPCVPIFNYISSISLSAIFFFTCQRSMYRLQCTWPYLILRHWYACSNAKRIIFSSMHTPISSGSCLLPAQQAQKHRRGMLCQKPSIRNREAEGEGRRNRMHLLCEHSNSIIEIVEFCVCA